MLFLFERELMRCLERKRRANTQIQFVQQGRFYEDVPCVSYEQGDLETSSSLWVQSLSSLYPMRYEAITMEIISKTTATRSRRSWYFDHSCATRAVCRSCSTVRPCTVVQIRPMTTFLQPFSTLATVGVPRLPIVIASRYYRCRWFSGVREQK